MYRTLEEFADWFLSQPLNQWRPVIQRDYGALIGTVIFCQPPFQVELVTVKANEVFPIHRHPNIDAMEVHVFGEVMTIASEDEQKAKEYLARCKTHRPAFGRRFRIKPEHWHSVKVGPAGGMFLSIQHWLNDVPPSAAGVDWIGAEMSEAHVGILKTEATAIE